LFTGCETVEKQARPSSAGNTSIRPAVAVIAPPSSPTVGPWPVNAPSIYADSAILIDAATGRTLFEKNADQRRQVASTQKLLTAFLIAERGSLDSTVVISGADTAVEPTKLGMAPGQRYSRRELLTAMMVKSCNDAAMALARDHSGSAAAFSQVMTGRAALMGAESSYFANPSGLPAPQFSTARDMARIAFRAYRQPELRAMMVMQSYNFRFNNGRIKHLDATNKLLARSPIFTGMKTGFTNAAGRCLVTSASFGGRQLILVQLGSRTAYIFNDAERMMHWGLGMGATYGAL
jgi:D-alanyl-D-alanine carboxypeptidase (penicillin-binding protein 5/6)